MALKWMCVRKGWWLRGRVMVMIGVFSKRRGYAEIPQQYRAVVVDEEIGRFDVAMDETIDVEVTIKYVRRRGFLVKYLHTLVPRVLAGGCTSQLPPPFRRATHNASRRRRSPYS